MSSGSLACFAGSIKHFLFVQSFSECDAVHCISDWLKSHSDQFRLWPSAKRLLATASG
jgi:hypothetical protein